MLDSFREEYTTGVSRSWLIKLVQEQVLPKQVENEKREAS